MHDSVRAWVATKAPLCPGAVLEVGSYERWRHVRHRRLYRSVRSLFPESYVGVDIQPGPGVDMVANGHDLPFAGGTFGTVVCTEMLEHDSAPWLSLNEMGRVLRPGGHLIITTRGNGFPKHEFPHDFWRFMPDSAPLLAGLAECDVLDVLEDPETPGIFIHGVRR